MAIVYLPVSSAHTDLTTMARWLAASTSSHSGGRARALPSVSAKTKAPTRSAAVCSQGYARSRAYAQAGVGQALRLQVPVFDRFQVQTTVDLAVRKTSSVTFGQAKVLVVAFNVGGPGGAMG